MIKQKTTRRSRAGWPQVDDEMRALLANLKEMVEAELAAKAGKKKKGGGKAGKVGCKKAADWSSTHQGLELCTLARSSAHLLPPLSVNEADSVRAGDDCRCATLRCALGQGQERQRQEGQGSRWEEKERPHGEEQAESTEAKPSTAGQSFPWR
jgi:hypothetical protein